MNITMLMPDCQAVEGAPSARQEDTHPTVRAPVPSSLTGLVGRVIGHRTTTRYTPMVGGAVKEGCRRDPSGSNVTTLIRARAQYVATMKSVSASISESPLVEMSGWGHGVVLRQDDKDVRVVERLMAAHPPPQRCGVIMEWMTTDRRRGLIEQLAAAGIGLQPLTTGDIALMTVKQTGADKVSTVGALLAATPFRLVMRLRRRSTHVFEVVRSNP